MKKQFTKKRTARDPRRENSPATKIDKCKKSKKKRLRELPPPELEDILL